MHMIVHVWIDRQIDVNGQIDVYMNGCKAGQTEGRMSVEMISGRKATLLPCYPATTATSPSIWVAVERNGGTECAVAGRTAWIDARLDRCRWIDARLDKQDG